MSDQALVVLCTAPSDQIATQLASGLVENRHAACVNVLSPVRSFYRWEGKVNDDQEVQLVIKTRRERFDELRDWLVAAHPYDVPEIIALPVTDGLPAYLKWIEEEC